MQEIKKYEVKEAYIKFIMELVKKCDDISFLDYIAKLIIAKGV